jgi:DhnA family fructose-bisphosphate aldolase class Ia
VGSAAHPEHLDLVEEVVLEVEKAGQMEAAAVAAEVPFLLEPPDSSRS